MRVPLAGRLTVCVCGGDVLKLVPWPPSHSGLCGIWVRFTSNVLYCFSFENIMIFQKSLIFFLSLWISLNLIMYYILKFPQRILLPFLLFYFFPPIYFVFPGLNDGFLCCDTWTEFQLLDVRTHCVYQVTKICSSTIHFLLYAWGWERVLSAKGLDKTSWWWKYHIY